MEDKQIFIGSDLEEIEQDYTNWKNQFLEYTEMEKNGIRFCLVNNHTIHKIVLFVDRIFTIKSDRLYIMEVSALKEFKNIEEAEANCHGVIEYYISGDVMPDDYIR